MKNVVIAAATALAVSSLVLVTTARGTSLSGLAGVAEAAQAPAPATAYRGPRTPDGKPNLNGIWQAFGDANWDIEPHAAAAPAIAVTGAIGATPPGMGIVEGGTIPYLPQAAAKKGVRPLFRHPVETSVRGRRSSQPRLCFQCAPACKSSRPTSLDSGSGRADSGTARRCRSTDHEAQTIF